MRSVTQWMGVDVSVSDIFSRSRVHVFLLPSSTSFLPALVFSFAQVYSYPGVYGDPYPRLHAHSLGLRADWVNGPPDDQTGAFWPGEPHRADVILEARADLRSDQPVACGGLRALQGPQPPALAVVANSPARCSSLISLMNSALVPLGRCPQQVRGSPTRCKMGAQRQCAACCQRVAAMAMANGPVGRHE